METSRNIQGSGGLINEVTTLLRTRMRDYAMYVALAVIFIFFGIFTGGSFLSPRNITNLINQTGYIAVLAVGMTLVLIIRQIDLSVGYAAGFLGAMAATFMVKFGIPIYLVIPMVLIFGMVIGLIQGFTVSYVGVPAFVTTLAFHFIFRGLLSLSTQESGTIRIDVAAYNNLSNGFVPDIGSVGGLHLVSLIVGAIAVVLAIMAQIKQRKNLLHYNFEVVSLPVFIFKLIFTGAAIATVAVVLAQYQGLSWTIVIVSIVVSIYNFMMNKTRLGRYIYGIGGNQEAAMLAGVNVKRTMLFVFMSMGTLAALSGILFTSRLQSASPIAGQGFELDSIAACYIGGVSTSGGIGKVGNTIIGALVIMSLTNGLNLMGIGISYQYVIKGAIFVLAVAFDVYTRGRKAI
ncbi:MAG: sugar ABC transporter permease [Clostridiales bacterium]|nr:sugar ABC transporter permease [Clostridiales bacterium]